ncbi:MAG: hypothetical protein CSA96_04085, partial [Bacteroidetes bacterium]
VLLSSQLTKMSRNRIRNEFKFAMILLFNLFYFKMLLVIEWLPVMAHNQGIKPIICGAYIAINSTSSASTIHYAPGAGSGSQGT